MTLEWDTESLLTGIMLAALLWNVLIMPLLGRIARSSG